jgi:hypothetical protein
MSPLALSFTTFPLSLAPLDDDTKSAANMSLPAEILKLFSLSLIPTLERVVPASFHRFFFEGDENGKA